jgi:hypothetical protein
VAVGETADVDECVGLIAPIRHLTAGRQRFSLGAAALRFYFALPQGMRHDLSAFFLNAPTIWYFA